jgi:cell shape-determining protein MreC
MYKPSCIKTWFKQKSDWVAANQLFMWKALIIVALTLFFVLLNYGVQVRIDKENEAIRRHEQMQEQLQSLTLQVAELRQQLEKKGCLSSNNTAYETGVNLTRRSQQ